MRLKQSLKLAALGAAAYPIMELAWRGRTAWPMAAAGSAGLILLKGVDRSLKDRPLWQRCLAGGAALTGMEYALGWMVNRRHQIWDYSRMPLHVQGQICPTYAGLWCLAALPGIWAVRRLTRT